MKKLYLLLVIISTFILTKAQTTDLRGVYIDNFDEILGDNSLEDQLLHYAQDSSFNYLALYSLSSINLNSSTNANQLASFMKRARQNFGIQYFGAVVESADGIQNRIIPYNNGRSDADEKFNVFNLEFEFWTNASVRSGGYYCSQYLQQANCSCDTSGGFKFFMRQITAIDSMATANGAISETYLGWFNEGQAQQMQRHVNRILLHAYRTDNSDVFAYSKTRLKYLASNNSTVNVAPIFSSEPDFMESWLDHHSETDAYTKYSNDFTADNNTWKQYVNLIGYHWFDWQYMPKPAPGASSGPAATITTSGSLTLCSGQSVNLTATQGTSYVWSNGATTRSISVNNAGSYTCAVTINGSVAITPPSTVVIKNNPTVSATASSNSNGQVALIANASAGSGTISSYQWRKDNIDIAGAITVNYTATASGDYSVEVANTYGCVNESVLQSVSVSSNTCTASIPTGLISATLTSTSEQLTWNAGQSGDSLVVRYKNETNAGDYQYVRMLYTGQTTISVSGLEPFNSYSWRVKMICGSTSGTYSNKEYFMTADSTSTIGIAELNSSQVKMYPNPASDVMKIAFPSVNKQNIEIQIADINGRIVSSEKKLFAPGNNTAIIETLNFQDGFYFLILKDELSSSVTKFSVIH